MKRYLPHIPALILSLGAILRVVTIGSAALWYDEAISLYRSTIPFMQLFSNGTDQSGSLILDLLLRITTTFNHHSIILLRLPSLIAGMISLWLVWLLMKKLYFTLEQQIASSILIAFLPGLLWLGQDARPYGITACILLAALYFVLDSSTLRPVYLRSGSSSFPISIVMNAGQLSYLELRSQSPGSRLP